MDNAHNFRSYPAVKLNLDLRQIRLATILPGRYVDAITCELNTASLDNIPEYYALSYAWGDRKHPRQIFVNSESFNITPNLEAALRRLRHPTESRLFWIDMICIDQECDEERTHQVNLMQLIYSSACEVFLWLGDYVETTTLQDQGLTSRSNEAQDYLDQIEAVRARSCIERLSADQHFDFDERGEASLLLSAELRALDKVMNRSWWHRIWAVQEAILPRKVTVTIGWLQFPWSTLAAAADNFHKHQALSCCSLPLGPGFLTLQAFHLRVYSIQRFRISYHQGRLIHLPDLLHEFRHRLCTDPRDKIFALLGLVMRDPKYQALKADYTLPVEAAYRDAFISLLQDERNLDLLIRQPELERRLDLPTWIPDWTAKVNELHANLDLYIRENTNLYNASRSTQLDVRWPDTTTTLGIKGIFFDKVATLAGPIPEDAVSSESTYNAYLDDLRTLFGITETQPQPYIGGGDRKYAFWRVISMDQVLLSGDDSTSGNVRRSTLEDYWKYLNTRHLSQNKAISTPYLLSFRFFISEMGYIGLGPGNMRVGDAIHVFLGGNVPFLLRKAFGQGTGHEQERTYEYIGNCYVEGIMDGEALHGMNMNRVDWVSII